MIDSILDALGYVGDTLDKAGPRPLRGLLAGKPREALSFVPFSDEMGLTDPKDIRTGRDVTNKFGITDPHDTGWGATGAGLLADALIDPVGIATGGYAGLKAARGIHSGLLSAAKASVSHSGSRLGMQDFIPRGFERASPEIHNALDRLGPQFDAAQGKNVFEEALRQYGHRMPEIREKYERLLPRDQTRIHQELGPGATRMTPGAEGLVFDNNGMITKISPSLNASLFGGVTSNSPVGRPNIPETLRPIRSNQFGKDVAGALTVEHMPKVSPLDKTYYDVLSKASSLEDLEQLSPAELGLIRNVREHIEIIDDELSRQLRTSIKNANPNLSPFDVRPANVSVASPGKLVIHDSGAIAPANEEMMKWMLMHPAFPTATRPNPDLLAELLSQNAHLANREGMFSVAGDPAMLARQGVEARPLERYGSIIGRNPGFPTRGIADPLGYKDELISEINKLAEKYADLIGQPEPQNNWFLQTPPTQHRHQAPYIRGQ
jgi:hypothetical protein